MWTNFFRMFSQFFTAMTVFGGSLEKVAKATDHLATWTEESAATFADQARIDRAIQLHKKKLELAAAKKPQLIEAEEPKAT